MATSGWHQEQAAGQLGAVRLAAGPGKARHYLLRRAEQKRWELCPRKLMGCCCQPKSNSSAHPAPGTPGWQRKALTIEQKGQLSAAQPALPTPREPAVVQPGVGSCSVSQARCTQCPAPGQLNSRFLSNTQASVNSVSEPWERARAERGFLTAAVNHHCCRALVPMASAARQRPPCYQLRRRRDLPDISEMIILNTPTPIIFMRKRKHKSFLVLTVTTNIPRYKTAN